MTASRSAGAKVPAFLRAPAAAIVLGNGCGPPRIEKVLPIVPGSIVGVAVGWVARMWLWGTGCGAGGMTVRTLWPHSCPLTIELKNLRLDGLKPSLTTTLTAGRIPQAP